MAWRRPGDKPLSEPILVSLLTHICVTRPQCVNSLIPARCGRNFLCNLGAHYGLSSCALLGKLIAVYCHNTIGARCCVAWGKFRELLPVLTSRPLSPKVHGRVYTDCFCLAMLAGSETWEPNTLDLKRLCCNGCAMIRWICGTKVQDETPSASLLKKLALRILWQYFSVGRWDGMVMWSVPGPVSDLSQTYRFPAPEGKEGLEQHGLNVSKLISMNVHMAWLALSGKTKMHGEPVFDIAWCCQPHQMGHRQHPNLKMDINWSQFWWHLKFNCHYSCAVSTKGFVTPP